MSMESAAVGHNSTRLITSLPADCQNGKTTGGQWVGSDFYDGRAVERHGNPFRLTPTPDLPSPFFLREVPNLNGHLPVIRASVRAGGTHL